MVLWILKIQWRISMDINKLDQNSGIGKIAKTNAERERVAAFKAVAKQEKNFAELIKQKEKTETNIKNLFDNRMGEKIETAYDKNGNVLFEKSKYVNSNPSCNKNECYYEYTDKETGNNVFFADFDNDGKMDYVVIYRGENFYIEGYDTDDDGIFDKVRYEEYKEGIDDGNLTAKQITMTALGGIKNQFKKDLYVTKKLLGIN